MISAAGVGRGEDRVESGRCRGPQERRIRGLWATALLAASALGCGPQAPPRNLVMIVVDTLRADALGVYGSDWPSSPRIDSFAGDSLVFDHARSQGTFTPASFLSYMSSTYVRTHGWDFHVAFYPESGVCGWTDLVLLAEVLGRAGFRTEAAVANFRLNQKAGFARGFERWNEVPAEEVAGRGDLLAYNVAFGDVRVTQAATHAVKAWEARERHFLYVHLMAPHLPLRPSKEALAALGIGSDWTPGGHIEVEEVGELNEQHEKVDPARFRLGYAASVWDADRSVGRILDAIDRSGHRDDTVVVFLSDHGEEIWEHGYYGHGWGVWSQLTHIPLVLRVPGREPGRVGDRAVALIDVAPTLLDLLEVEERPESWQGASLFDAAPRRPVVSERFSASVITQDGVVEALRRPWRTGGTWRFFDLAEDPSEQEPLPWLRHGLPLRETFEGWDAETPRVTRDVNAEPVGACRDLTPGDREHLEEQLRALGYAQ